MKGKIDLVFGKMDFLRVLYTYRSIILLNGTVGTFYKIDNHTHTELIYSNNTHHEYGSHFSMIATSDCQSQCQFMWGLSLILSIWYVFCMFSSSVCSMQMYNSNAFFPFSPINPPPPVASRFHSNSDCVYAYNPNNCCCAVAHSAVNAFRNHV